MQDRSRFYGIDFAMQQHGHVLSAGAMTARGCRSRSAKRRHGSRTDIRKWRAPPAETRESPKSRRPLWSTQCAPGHLASTMYSSVSTQGSRPKLQAGQSTSADAPSRARSTKSYRCDANIATTRGIRVKDGTTRVTRLPSQIRALENSRMDTNQHSSGIKTE